MKLSEIKKLAEQVRDAEGQRAQPKKCAEQTLKLIEFIDRVDDLAEDNLSVDLKDWWKITDEFGFEIR